MTKQVNVRKFLREFYSVINELPLVVTKNGKPFMQVASYDLLEKNQVTLNSVGAAMSGSSAATSNLTASNTSGTAGGVTANMIKTPQDAIKQVSSIQEEKAVELCEHGFAKGLCKFGCI